MLEEIQIMRIMNHDNVIRLYEVHETNGSLYLVITLVNGGELTKAIQLNKFTHEWHIRYTLYNML